MSDSSYSPARPSVSLLVAMRNEEEHIGRLLQSIFLQDYPAGLLETRIYDGGSTDASWEIAERACAGRPMTVLAHNARTSQAAAWNIGIDEASGAIIGIVSAHSQLAPDYVSTAVETLFRTGAEMVGGPVRPVSETPVGEAVAVATSTAFGIGNARFHFADSEQEVDTVFMGVCRSETYRSLKFDEEMIRDQDDELSYRLLDRGGRIICNPRIRSTYVNRATFRSLWRQYFEYGYWKVRVMQKHPRQVRVRQLVPPAFVGTVIATATLSPILIIARVALVTTIAAYAIANGAFSIWLARSNARLLPYLALTFAFLHVSYGVGVLGGAIRFRRRWFGRTDSVARGRS